MLGHTGCELRCGRGERRRWGCAPDKGYIRRGRGRRKESRRTSFSLFQGEEKADISFFFLYCEGNLGMCVRENRSPRPFFPPLRPSHCGEGEIEAEAVTQLSRKEEGEKRSNFEPPPPTDTTLFFPHPGVAAAEGVYYFLLASPLFVWVGGRSRCRRPWGITYSGGGGGGMGRPFFGGKCFSGGNTVQRGNGGERKFAPFFPPTTTLF